MPLFSVIIPTKNRKELLRNAIESVLNQSYESFEIIIVDDHSTDGSVELIRSLDDNRIRCLTNKGIERSAARNTGIEEASGNYICFLDDDDQYKRDYLLNFYQYLTKYDFPVNVILRTGFEKIDQSKLKSKSAMYAPDRHKDAHHFAAYDMCGIWSLCIPVSLLQNNKFDERFPHWQDSHLILRILSLGRLIQQNTYNYIYNIHPSMGSKMAVNPTIIKERCRLNIAAIDDYFTNYNKEKILDIGDWKFLRAEKYLQYANACSDKKISNEFFKKSINEGWYIKLWKSYLINLKKKLTNGV